MKILAAMFVALTGSAQVAVIGNTGSPQTTTGHVPFLIVGLAADHQGHVYTVHSWDEPHQDIMEWDAATGQKLYNTGQVVPEALLNAIAVEPDSSVAYVTGLTQETPATTFRLYKVNLGSAPGVVNFTSAGRSVLLGSGQPLYSKFLVKVTRSCIEVGDPNNGIISSYDKSSGALITTKPGTLPDDSTVSTGHHTVSRSFVANGDGSRLLGQGWEQRCTEFASSISYSRANPNTFISSSRNLYDRSGAWLGCGITDITKEPPTTGPCKTITLGGNDFFYFPYVGQYLNIYRISGLTMSVVLKLIPPSNLFLQSFGVSPDGTLWLSVVYQLPSGEFCALYKLPLNSLDSSGNPVYQWADATQIVSQNALLAAFGQTDPRSVGVQMANYNPGDSLIYALLYVPQGPSIGPFWMAGNALAAFTLQGALAWKLVLPAAAVGMATVPTGGVLLGRNVDQSGAFAGGTIDRYSNGTLVATLQPPAQYGGYSGVDIASGDFDSYGALNCEQAPDGLLDIFAEDVYNGRVFWYRINP